MLPVGAAEVDNLRNNNKANRKLFVFNSKLAEIKGSKDASISAIKTASDFNGRIYSIIECSPTGYMIYSNDTAVFVEYAINSPSPYLNVHENLYYGGPTFYYQIIENKLIHTIQRSEKFDAGYINEFSNSSKLMYEQLSKIKDVPTLEYVTEGKSSYSSINLAPITPMAYKIYTGKVKNPEFFRNLSSFGYWGGDKRCPKGCCGFVGLNMLVAYHDKYKNNNIMDDSFWSNSGKTLLKSGDSSLTKYLFNLDPKASTTSMHIHSVMKQYAKKRRVSVSHTSLYWGFFNDSTVRKKIDRNVPVELFGNMLNVKDYDSKINHTVVAFEYRRSTGFLTDKTSYTVHYGWEGYSSVVINITIGSMYCFE